MSGAHCRNCAICVTSLNMRKWMRERLQRRKKKAPEPGSQAAPPPPLQPAYFDAEETPRDTAEPSQHEVESPEIAEPPAEQPAEEGSSGGDADQSPGRTPTQDARRGKGRRRRGGRGRGGRGREQAVAQAFAPAAVKGPIPGAPVEPVSVEEEPAGEPEAEPLVPMPQAPAVPAAVPSAPARPPKGIVVLAIGLPGSGKSSWFKRHNVVP